MVEKIECIVRHKQWGRDVWRGGTTGPKDILGADQVALCTIELDGEHGAFLVTGPGVDDAIGVNGRGDDIVRQTANVPQHLATGEIVPAHGGGGADDEEDDDNNAGDAMISTLP